MALIPVTDKFHLVDTTVDTTNRGSAQANSLREAYTMQDVIDTVGNTGGSQPVATGLVAQGTNNTTTSIMSYGINIFSTSTGTDYATKLPQPITGQTVTIINNGATPIFVFPSNVGGQINDLAVDAPLIVANDGTAVNIICTVNPLPGQWATLQPMPINERVYEFTISHTNGVLSEVNGIPTQNDPNITMHQFNPTVAYSLPGSLVDTNFGTAPNETLPGQVDTIDTTGANPAAALVNGFSLETNILATDIDSGDGIGVVIRRYLQHETGDPASPYATFSGVNMRQKFITSSLGTGVNIVDPATTGVTALAIGCGNSVSAEIPRTTGSSNMSQAFDWIGGPTTGYFTKEVMFNIVLIVYANMPTKDYKFRLTMDLQ